MANTNVFRGSDATITLAVADAATPEGNIANATISFYQLSPVGRATGVEVYVHTDLQEYHEIGRRHPSQLHPGNIHISGKVTRAYINGALLILLLGQGAATERSSTPFPQPSFNIQLQLQDPAVPGVSNTLTIHGVKFDNWALALPEDDFVMESATFKALFVTVEDKQEQEA
ncbi:MAG: hypothetical protein JNJ61_11740 [Anaerolineae bacterium]|nr:hypothetical protein [Anaerolineae bacterium]